MRSLVKKKINTRLAFVYYPNGNEMDQRYAMTLHVIAYRSTELLFGTHTFNFNCFFDHLIAYLHKYAAYLDC